MRTNPTYADIYIGSLDQAYIDRIAYETGVDETEEAVLYSLDTDKPCIANDIIDYIITTAIYNLDISYDSKDILIDRKYTNCLDSGFTDDDLSAFPEDERKIIEDFINIF